MPDRCGDQGRSRPGPPSGTPLRLPAGCGVGRGRTPAAAWQDPAAAKQAGDGLEPQAAAPPGQRRLHERHRANAGRTDAGHAARSGRTPRGDAMTGRLPSPFDVATPAGADGWHELYSYSLLFSDDRRGYEDSMFWFIDGIHTPEVLCPWDATILEFALIVLSQYNTRHYLI